MKVLKFGGTSIGSAKRIENVLNITKEQQANIIVLSAMSGTTNELIHISESKELTEVKNLHNKYQEIVYQLLKSTDIINNALAFVNIQFQEIESLISQKISYINEIIAKGEILSTTLFSFYLTEQDVKHQLLNSLDIIRTNKNEEPDIQFIKNKFLKTQISEDKVYILQGFICRDDNGNISNLKRGGSDYTASIVGEAINAKEIQIWTDIDGFHNNDPRYVENTKSLSYLSYDEAAELAYFGAKILHPNTLIPAKRANIPVWLKNSLEPSQKGTVIGHDTVDSQIKAIAAKDGITAIKIKSSRMLLAYGFLTKVFQIFENYKTPIDMIATSEIAVSLTIDNTKYLKNIENELVNLGELEIDKNQSIICIVGNMISSNKGTVTQIFNTLNDIPIRMVSYGGSNHNISILVDETDKIEVLNNLHQNLFKNELASTY